jgi:Cof subfamily protein (haloacid dehalogenase superfamily)
VTRWKALAIDVDGTLINSDKRIPDFTRSEIHRVVDEYGVRIFIVTARGPASARTVVDELGVDASLAAFGGAFVSTSANPVGRVLAAHQLSSDAVTAMVAAAADADVYIGVHTEQSCVVNRFDYWARREARNTAVWPVVATARADGAPDFPVDGVYKVMFRGEVDELAQVHAALTSLPGIYPHHNNRVLEVVREDAVKLPAVRLLAQDAGCSIDHVIAFGDTEADIEMLEGVGQGVLMGNASVGASVSPAVIRTLANDEDGIGIVLRELFPTSAPFRP